MIGSEQRLGHFAKEVHKIIQFFDFIHFFDT